MYPFINCTARNGNGQFSINTAFIESYRLDPHGVIVRGVSGVDCQLIETLEQFETKLAESPPQGIRVVGGQPTLESPPLVPSPMRMETEDDAKPATRQTRPR